MAIKEQENWRSVLLPGSANIRDAIRCLDEVALQIAIIVDPKVLCLNGDRRRYTRVHFSVENFWISR